MPDTSDIAAAAVTAVTNNGHENKAYDITGSAAISNYEIAAVLSKVTERTITYVDISEEDARKGMKDSGTDECIIEVLMELGGFQKAGYASMVSPNLEEATARKPISFLQFIHENAKNICRLVVANFSKGFA